MSRREVVAMVKLLEVVWRVRTFMVDEDGVVQPVAGIEMEAYDRELVAAGYVFVDDNEEVTEITFVGDPEAD